jgi:hypothetical protein
MSGIYKAKESWLSKNLDKLSDLAEEHPNFATALVMINIFLVIYAIFAIFLFITKSSEKFDSGNILVTSPASALDRKWGACLSEPGRDHCGAAEPFASKKYMSHDDYLRHQSQFATHPMLLKDLHKHRQGFLNERGSGPDFTGSSALETNYWYSELNGDNASASGDEGADSVQTNMAAAQAAAQAVQAVQSGVIPASAAPAVASSFAAQKVRQNGFASDDALLATQLARTH